MAVYYAQLLSQDTKKILSGAYSANGQPLKDNKAILFELRDVVRNAPGSTDNRIYTAASKHGNYLLCLQHGEGFIVGIVADRRVGVERLDRLVRRIIGDFLYKYKGDADTHYEYDEDIRRICDEYNKGAKLNRGVEELEEAHGVLVENLDVLMKRGENINNLKDLADKVSFETREMSRRVSQIRRNAQLEKYKVYGVLAVCFIIILYFFFYK